ncbi:MAG: Mut7-C RNAse domain-containing protein [bacterium]
MSKIKIRFFAELNDFLIPSLRQKIMEFDFRGKIKVKDLIESYNIPHPEVELIIVNGKSVDFSYQVKSGDFIAVYPVFESLEVSPVIKLRDHPLRKIKFVLDVHLGKLCRNLRLLGLDTYYENNLDDDQLAAISHSQHRILITRDINLLKRTKVIWGYWIREKDPYLQTLSVIRRFDLSLHLQPFSRCLRCNQKIERVDKPYIQHRLPVNTRKYFENFYLCSNCDRIYWKGSHYKNMVKFVEKVIKHSNENHPQKQLTKKECT